MTVVRLGTTARRMHYCRACHRETEQRLLAIENGYPQDRTAETWRCVKCELALLTLGDVPDAEGLCLWVIQERFRFRRETGVGSGTGGNTPVGRSGDPHKLATRSDDRWLDYEDAFGHLRHQIVVLWTRWDPARGVPFRAYASGELRNDLTDWLRTQIGRDRPKPFSNALALDDDRAADGSGGAEGSGEDGSGLLEALLGGTLDDDSRSLTDLRRAVVLRGGDLAQLDRERGVGSDA